MPVNCVFSLTFYPFFGRLSAPCPYRPTNRHDRENGCRPADGTAPVRRKTHRRILPAPSLRRIPANRNMPTREMHRCRTAAPNTDPPNNHPRRSRSQHSEARSEKAGNAGQTRAVPEHADICDNSCRAIAGSFQNAIDRFRAVVLNPFICRAGASGIVRDNIADAGILSTAPQSGLPQSGMTDDRDLFCVDLRSFPKIVHHARGTKRPHPDLAPGGVFILARIMRRDAAFKIAVVGGNILIAHCCYRKSVINDFLRRQITVIHIRTEIQQKKQRFSARLCRAEKRTGKRNKPFGVSNEISMVSRTACPQQHFAFLSVTHPVTLAEGGGVMPYSSSERMRRISVRRSDQSSCVLIGVPSSMQNSSGCS